MNKDTDRKCYTVIYKMYFKKILFYEAEIRTCTKRQESKIQAIQTKFLISIMEKTKRDKIRYAHIKEELRREDIHDQIKGNKTEMVQT
jgi:hypothetical protein